MDQLSEILVISSDLGNRRALVEILHRGHWDTICASTVNECLELFAARDVALVFCDRQLSDGTYRDVLKIIRSLYINVPLVVTSRLADWDEYFMVLQEGAFDLIVSPCRTADVTWVTLRARHEHRKQRLPISCGKARDDMSSEKAIRAEDEIRIGGPAVDGELRTNASSA